ncbi:MAG: radical SAM family heme chaperone HemW [Clostridia bacterium]|nr:radical SAM family heme chaperone HemW [Clostridia bacterium]
MIMTDMVQKENTVGLYLHVPFCVAKCRYCDFYSAAAPREVMSRYAKVLAKELKSRAPLARGLTVDTVYIGGGTPTLLAPADIAHLLDTVRQHYTLDPAPEVTVECNPQSFKAGIFEALLGAGVNRLSIGLQSSNDRELLALGRPHDMAAFVSTYRAAREAGFQNINVDIMFGIPHQTRESLGHTLNTVLAYAPEHISAYGLRVEEGTPFWQERHTLPIADEDTVADMQLTVAEVLGGAGFEHYEVSNYARAGYRSRHNMRYWLGKPYLGFGPAAHSFFDGVRYEAPCDTGGYIRAVEEGNFSALQLNAHRITPHEAMEEYVMLRMRLFEGIEEKDFSARFGISFEEVYGNVENLIRGGLLTKKAGRIAFTEQGMYVLNAILSEWLDFKP